MSKRPITIAFPSALLQLINEKKDDLPVEKASPYENEYSRSAVLRTAVEKVLSLLEKCDIPETPDQDKKGVVIFTMSIEREQEARVSKLIEKKIFTSRSEFLRFAALTQILSLEGKHPQDEKKEKTKSEPLIQNREIVQIQDPDGTVRVFKRLFMGA